MGTEISTVSAKLRDDFSATELNNSNWDIKLGPGASIDLSQPSALRISAGTTANSETTLRSRNAWITPFRAMFLAQAAALVSQRIANQEIEFRVVSPDGREFASWVLDGTVATSYKVRSGNGGVAATDTTVTGRVDSTTGNVVLELELFLDEVYWHQRVADSVNPRSFSDVRNRRVPDPTRELHIEVRIKNGATAPATNTVVSLEAILMQDISELTTEITAGRGGGAASQSIPVSVIGSPIINTNSGKVTQINVISTTEPLSVTNLGVSGIYAQTGLDSGADPTIRPTRRRPVVMHQAGTTPGRLVFEESTDNAVWRETWSVPIPSDGGYHTFEVMQHLRYTRFRFLNGVTAQTAFFLSDIGIRGEGASEIDKVLTFPLTAAGGQALGASTTLTGPAIDLGSNHQWDSIVLAARSDQASAAGGVFLQWSADGTNWFAGADSATLTAAGPIQRFQSPVVSRYVRAGVTNAATAAAGLWLQMSLYTN